ncbi:MAG: hypothetical protein M3280_12395 [Actinomycetota bacterium]|nr:hypothetical protein [Actinomycetota bacterium]
MNAFTNAGTENQMVWDRTSRGFMEVWYATMNHEQTGAGIWLRYTLTSPLESEPFCELWGFVFDPSGRLSFAKKERFGIDRLGRPRDDGAIVRIGDAWLSENHLEGSLESENTRLSWSLDFEPAGRCFQHLPRQLRDRIEKRVSTVCSPNLSVPFSGEVKVGRERLRLNGEHGCQSHRWGRSHSESWTWAHCRFADGSVFEGVAARARLGPLPAPTSTFVYLNHAGRDLEFNDLRCALRSRSRYELPEWKFTARCGDQRLVGTALADPERMYQATYVDPDGSKRYCANSEIADMALQLFRRVEGSWVLEDRLSSAGRAHVEFGRRDPWPLLEIAV